MFVSWENLSIELNFWLLIWIQKKKKKKKENHIRSDLSLTLSSQCLRLQFSQRSRLWSLYPLICMFDSFSSIFLFGSWEKWKNLFEKKNYLSRLHSTSFMYANVYFPSLFFLFFLFFFWIQISNQKFNSMLKFSQETNKGYLYNRFVILLI